MASSPSFSSPQQIALAVAPVVTGVLSFLGSLCIIYIIVKEREKKLQKTYHRLLLAMSAADIVGSVRACCSSFAMPVGSWWMAHGNTATCEFQGFAAQLSISAALYSACLGIYFFITIKNVDKSKIARCIEPVMHGLAILFPVTTAIAGLVLNLFNPVELGVGCWVSAYPTGCADTLDIECTRGQNAGILVLLFGGIPVALSLVGHIGRLIYSFLLPHILTMHGTGYCYCINVEHLCHCSLHHSKDGTSLQRGGATESQPILRASHPSNSCSSRSLHRCFHFDISLDLHSTAFRERWQESVIFCCFAPCSHILPLARINELFHLHSASFRGPSSDLS